MIWFLMSISTLLLGSAYGLILRETQILPRNEKEYIAFTKDIHCPNETLPHYVPSSTLFKTYITCWKKRIVFGCCLEYNEGGGKVQLSYGRICTGYPLSPCKPFYNSTDSYKIFECFEKYGGILSPKQQTKKLQYCRADLQQTKNISEECTISQQNTEMELNKTLKAEKLEAKKYQDCKDDLNVKKIVLGVLVPIVALVCFFTGCGFTVLKKLMTRRRKNSDGNSLDRGNIDKCKGKNKSESSVKTEKEDDEIIKEEIEMENLINKLESNDCDAESKAIPVSEEDNAYTVEKGKISEFLNLNKRSPIRPSDIDRGFAEQ